MRHKAEALLHVKGAININTLIIKERENEEKVVA